MTPSRTQVTASRVTCWALLLLCMILVGWIRLLPQSLGTVDDRAERIARRQLQEPSTVEEPGSVAATARRLRSDLTYAGEDGREYVYLGDFDSYLWLRYARNYLRTGTPCDAVIDGECRDTYTNAPVGGRTIYARSLHPAAMAGLHRVITLFRPMHPLPASAFLLPVIVGVLGVVPAFFIARRLAGTTAGAFAGVLTAVHPIVLTRTIGSDNDVWNVVLPLYMAWAAMVALDSTTSLRASLWAGLAGVALGLQAWAWRGWLFFYMVLMAGLMGAALAHGLRFGIRRRTARIWQAPDLRRSALVLVVFYAVAWAGATLAGSEEPYFTVPVKAMQALIGAAGENTSGGGGGSDWPSALSSVAELAPLRLSGIARANGSTAVFLGSLLGLLLVLLPADRWRWHHRAVLGAGVPVYGYGLLAMERGRVATLVLLAAPLAGALIAQWDDEEPRAARRGLAFVVVVWFLAAVPDGVRWPPLLAVAGATIRDCLCGRRGTPRLLGQEPDRRDARMVPGHRRGSAEHRAHPRVAASGTLGVRRRPNLSIAHARRLVGGADAPARDLAPRCHRPRLVGQRALGDLHLRETRQQ